MLSIPHLIVIFVVALVVFGPEKLPELARNLGKVMAEFRRHTNDLRSTFEGHLRDLEREADARRVSPAPPPNTIAQPAPTPGTVPSNPPNAAAIAASADATSKDVPAEPSPRKYPGDDPYLAELTNGEFGVPESAPSPPPEQHAAGADGEPSPASEEKTPQRVTDGDVRPA